MATLLPHPPRKFLIGNLPQIAGKDTMNKMIQLGYDYDDPLLEIKVLHIKLLFIHDFALAKEMLQDDEKFPKFIDVPVEHLRDIAGDGLFTAHSHEPNWQKAHNILTPGFAMKSIRGYVPAMKKICDQLLEQWDKVPEGEYINLAEDMTKLTFETIGVCGFDYSFGCFENEQPHDFIPAMLFALDEAVARARTIPFLIPFRFKQNKLYKEYLTYTDNLIDNIIRKRKEDAAANTAKYDLLSLMLNAKDKASGDKLTDENIRFQIYTFLVAGHETTSGLLSFVFYELINNPAWLEKVYEEIDGVWGASADYTATHRDLPKFKIIKQVLLETLRLYPPVPIINVAPTKATTIGAAEYPVAAKQSCLIWTYHVHRDKKVWGENAEQFNPTNFTTENIAKRDPYAFKAFGNGKRACIGRQFAITEATLAVATILHRFKMHIDPDYKFELDETITLRPKNFRVRLEKRTDADRYFMEPIVTEAEKEVQQKTTIVQHQTPFLVLYGSNMGSSEDLALRIAKDAKLYGFDAKVATLDDYSGKLPERGLIQIVTSTYNGTPPDNAKKFHHWLENTKQDLSKVRYSVFGCGNSQWDTFQNFPNFVDRNLKRLGASRFHEKGSADASTDFEGDFEAWYAHYWQQLVEELELKKQAVNDTLQIMKNVANYVTSSHRPYNNSEASVARVCAYFDLDASTFVQIYQAPPILLQDLLSYQIDLEAPATLHQLELLIKATACPPEKIKLQQYFNQHEAKVVAPNKTIIDILEEFEACECSFGEFLGMM